MSCSSLVNPAAEKLGYTTFYSLNLVVSLVGNFLIGMIVYKTPTLRKPINIVIANMAMSDLLFPIFLFPVRLGQLYFDSWFIGGTLGKALCRLHIFLLDVSVVVSIQSLVLIAVDRFGAVVFPLQPPLISRKRCRLFIPAKWIVAMIVGSPYLFAFKLVELPTKLYCNFRHDKILSIYLFTCIIVFWFIPAGLLVILYSIIVIKLKKQAHPGEQSAIAEEQRARRNRNVLKMAIAIVVIFFFCWIPWAISMFQLLAPDVSVRSIWSSCSFELYSGVATCLASANCAFNPIICFVFSSNHRKGFKRLVTCRAAVQG